MFWATIDAPWLHKVEAGEFARELARVRAMEPRLVLSSRLPAAPGAMLDRLVAALEAALELLLARLTAAAPQ